jgi:hypothetical protein
MEAQKSFTLLNQNTTNTGPTTYVSDILTSRLRTEETERPPEQADDLKHWRL